MQILPKRHGCVVKNIYLEQCLLGKQNIQSVVRYNNIMIDFPQLDQFPKYKKLRESQPFVDNQNFVPIVINNIFNKQETEYMLNLIESFPLENIRVQKWGGQGILDDIKITENIKKKIEDIATKNIGEEMILENFSIARYSADYGYEVKLFPHYDTRKAEMFVLDIQLKTNQDWGIIVEGCQYNIKDNDALLFSGTQQMHWRERKKLFKESEIYMMFCWIRHKIAKPISVQHDIIMKERESILMQETNITSEERISSYE